MFKLITLIKLAQQAYNRSLKINVKLKIFSWFQTNSYGFSNKEFDCLWGLLIQVFNDAYGSYERFKNLNGSSLDLFDIKSSNDEVGVFLFLLNKRVNKLKVFM